MPLKSMTAFGSGEATSQAGNYRCEIKSLNSRFIEVNVRLPRFLAALESDMINLVKAAIKRGKVDVYFDIAGSEAAKALPRLNLAALEHYLDAIESAEPLLERKKRGDLIEGITLTDLFRLDGVLESSVGPWAETQADQHAAGLTAALDQALGRLKEARETEGLALKTALVALVDSLRRDREMVASKTDEIQAHIYKTYRKRLDNILAKMEESGQKVAGALPEDRLLAEIAILTDKADIEEELTRLATHEAEFLKQLDEGEEVGRKLDFLCQEMHREVNTMSNKMMHLDVAKHTLAMKQTVERLRQQIQNLE